MIGGPRWLPILRDPSGAARWDSLPEFVRRELEPNRVPEACLADVLFLLDHLFRLCITLDPKETPPNRFPNAYSEAWRRSGYGTHSARWLGCCVALKEAAKSVIAFADAIHDLHSRGLTTPPDDDPFYSSPALFSVPAVFSVWQSLYKWELRISILRSLGQQLLVHVALLKIHLIMRERPTPNENLGMTAAHVLLRAAADLMDVALNVPGVLPLVDKVTRKELSDVVTTIRNHYASDLQADLISKSRVVPTNSANLVLFDTEVVTAVAAVELILARLGVDDDERDGGQEFERKKEEYRNLFQLSRPNGLRLGFTGFSELNTFVVPRGEASPWPASLPEVESVVRLIVLAHVMTVPVLQTDESPGDGNEWRAFVGSDGSVVTFRVPTGLAFPMGSGVAALVMKSVMRVHPLLVWMTLPSTLSDPHIDGCFSPMERLVESLSATMDDPSLIALWKTCHTFVDAAVAGAGVFAGIPVVSAFAPTLPPEAVPSVSAASVVLLRALVKGVWNRDLR